MLNASKSVCNDPRRSEGQRDYDRRTSQMTGYQCTGPNDFERLYNNIAQVRKELAQCRNKNKELLEYVNYVK